MRRNREIHEKAQKQIKIQTATWITLSPNEEITELIQPKESDQTDKTERNYLTYYLTKSHEIEEEDLSDMQITQIRKIKEIDKFTLQKKSDLGFTNLLIWCLILEVLMNISRKMRNKPTRNKLEEYGWYWTYFILQEWQKEELQR